MISFEAGQNIHAGKTALLGNRFAALLARTGKYELIHPYQMNQTLIAHRFDRTAYREMKEYSIAAGKILKVKYVICGHAEKVGQRYMLRTSLIEVRTGRIINAVRSYYTGEFDNFLKLAPESNLKHLLGLKEIPPAFPKPPKPKVKPPKPELEKPEPKPAKPKPPEVIPEPEMKLKKLEAMPPMREIEWREIIRNAQEKTQDFVAGHLEVGTRITSFKLLKENKDSFLGSIDHLDAKQDLAPFKIFAHWFFTPRYGIELAWDHIEAATVTTEDGHSDGNIVLTGPIITVFARHPMDIMIKEKALTLVPYGGIGFVILDASFEHESWWHHGFSEDQWPDAEARYNEWVASGSPPWPNGGYQRTMNLDDTIGFVLSAGCATKINKSLSIDFYLRYMDVDVDDKYTLSRYGEVFHVEYATFPMSNYALGLGIKYAF